MTANELAAIAQTPAARPSTPSEKLTTLMISTIPTIVSGAPRSPRSTRCTNGSVKSDTLTPFATGTVTAATWPASFSAGCRSMMSSMAPTRVMIVAPTRIDR